MRCARDSNTQTRRIQQNDNDINAQTQKNPRGTENMEKISKLLVYLA